MTVSDDNDNLDTFSDYEEKVKPHLDDKQSDSYSDLESSAQESRDDYKNLKSLVLDKNRVVAEVENIESVESSESIDVKKFPRKGNHLETRETK